MFGLLLLTWKSNTVTYCECVSVLLPSLSSMQSTCAVLFFHLWPVWLYRIFPYCLTNGTTIGKKVIEHNIYVLISSTVFVWNISHSKRYWARYHDKFISHRVKNPFILPDFNQTWIFSTEFLKILDYQISRKSVLWEPSCSIWTG